MVISHFWGTSSGGAGAGSRPRARPAGRDPCAKGQSSAGGASAGPRPPASDKGDRSSVGGADAGIGPFSFGFPCVLAAPIVALNELRPDSIGRTGEFTLGEIDVE